MSPSVCRERARSRSHFGDDIVMQSLTLDRTPAPPHGGAPGAPEQLDTVIDGLQARITRMAAYYARCSRIDREDLLQDAWLCVLEAHREFDSQAGSLQP